MTLKVKGWLVIIRNDFCLFIETNQLFYIQEPTIQKDTSFKTPGLAAFQKLIIYYLFTINVK